MFGMQTLDIAAGLIFVYFVLSIICSAGNEMLASLLTLRAKTLVAGIENLLKDQGIPDLERKFYDHPLIKSLCKGSKKPSYIPSRSFALALVDLIAPAREELGSYMTEVRGAIGGLPEDSRLRRMMLIFLDEAQNDLQKFKAGIETWFNDAMDRVSGWYKRKVQYMILLIAAGVAFVANADTIQIVRNLSHDPVVREEMARMAVDYIDQRMAPPVPARPQKPTANIPAAQKLFPRDKTVSPSAETPQITIQKAWKDLETMQASGIPLGWKTFPSGNEWMNKIFGLLLTVLAISLGAPFWFDLLNKIVPLRSVGAAPKTKEEK